MLKNAYLLAKIGADTAKNEQNFAEILRKIGNVCASSAWRSAARARGSARAAAGGAATPGSRSGTSGSGT